MTRATGQVSRSCIWLLEQATRPCAERSEPKILGAEPAREGVALSEARGRPLKEGRQAEPVPIPPAAPEGEHRLRVAPNGNPATVSPILGPP